MSDNTKFEHDPKAGGRTVVCFYPYHDAAGTLIYEKIRYLPKAFSFRRFVDGRAINHIQGVPRVPYRLPAWKDASSVLLCEGEKDADNLAVLGFATTCAPEGAGSWADELTPHFKDKLVFICYHVGEEKHAGHVAARLHGTAKEIRIASLGPGRPHEFDYTDLLNTVPPEDTNRQGEQKKLVDNILRDEETYRPPCVLDYCVSSLWIRNQDIKIEWLLENLIPKNGITVFSGLGGSGKTYLTLQILNAIADGQDIFGLKTEKTTVFYIDHENPMSVMKDRLDKLGCECILHWSLWSSQPPPKMDSDDWTLYKLLPQGSLACFDSLRSIQNLDENSTRDMAFIMGRFKELREQGITPYILHHTPKSDPHTFRGAGPISDLADHTLNLFTGKDGTKDRVFEEGEPGQPCFFGCSGKSRYEQHRVLLTFNADGSGFSLAADPDAEVMHDVRDYLLSQAPTPLIQKDLCAYIEEGYEKSPRGGRRLLTKGEKLGYWHSWTEKPPGGGRRKYYAAK
jgi:hypothetical protein